MDGGDIIYIVFLAVILLGGLFRKNKKTGREPARGTTPFPAEGYPDDDEPDVWLPADEQPAPRAAQPPAPPANPPQPPIPAPHNRVRRTVAAPSNAPRPATPSEPAGRPSAKIALDTAGEARKAFIYSEIFRRKY